MQFDGPNDKIKADNRNRKSCKIRIERGPQIMNIGQKKLPVGIESFEEIRRENFYYIDKTGMIRELLQKWSKVNLFTRPRRFGKSVSV